MTTLAVAGLSARLMAEAAANDGFEVVALDLFGDVDTCAVASRWLGIGEPASLQIDGDRVLAALAMLARQGDVAGWIAGSGFEGRPELLAQGAALLPLIGTQPDAVARLRDPAGFFHFLDDHGIEHPLVRLAPAEDGSDWLLKDAHGSGGWHIRRVPSGAALAALATLAPGQYLQREVAGLPMSATFVCAGGAVRLLGVNRQIVRAAGASPHVFCGVIGPVPVTEAVLQRLQAILRVLAGGFALCGLASLDFLLDGGRVQVLEVNPRPPASMDLYPRWHPMAAHVRAHLHGELPSGLEPDSAAAATSAFAAAATTAATAAIRGHEIVFAPRPLRLAPALADWLASLPDAHDLPAAGQQFAAGDPLCSIGAVGRSAAEVLQRLHERRDALLQSLETVS